MFVTIVIPCLNERKTISQAITQASLALKKNHLDGEIIVADNGSTDGTLQKIAAIKNSKNLRLIAVPVKGYGAALHYGILAAKGKYVFFADADLSYHFTELPKFTTAVQILNADLVLGTRLGGTIKDGAMPWLHRYVGTPILTRLINIMYYLPTTDCNSGMRLVKKTFYKKLKMRNSGMEWASELLIKTALARGKYAEVPITLYPDKRQRKPHLVPFSDGWRHLKAILLLKPDSLLVLIILGFVVAVSLYQRAINVSLLVLFGTIGLCFSWTAAHVINYAITGERNRLVNVLISVPLVKICSLATLVVLLHSIYMSLIDNHISVVAIFLSSLVIMMNIWLFFIETIKTHFLHRLPEKIAV